MILNRDKIRINCKFEDKYEAVRAVGQMLVDGGHVPEDYIQYMIQREDDLSTYMGSGLAIPHGTNEAKKLVRSTGMAIALSPEGVEFGIGKKAHLIVGIAAVGNDHMELLTNIAMLVTDEDVLNELLAADSESKVLEIFEKGAEE